MVSILHTAGQICLGAMAFVVLLLPFILSAYLYGTDSDDWAFVAVGIYFIPIVTLFLWALGDTIQEAGRWRR
jgi:hypothetical protein